MKKRTPFAEFKKEIQNSDLDSEIKKALLLRIEIKYLIAEKDFFTKAYTEGQRKTVNAVADNLVIQGIKPDFSSTFAEFEKVDSGLEANEDADECYTQLYRNK